MKKSLIITLCLLTMGAALFAAPKSTKLYDAVVKGNFDKVQKEVEKNPDSVNTPGMYQNMPIEVAVGSQSLEIFTYLIENGAKITKKTVSNIGSKKNYEMLSYLIDNELINVNDYLYELSFLYKRGEEPLEDTLKKANEITKGTISSPLVLLYIKADDYEETNAFFNFDLNAPVDENGCSLLFKAANAKNVDLVNFLLDHKADLNKKNNNGQTVLFYAITAYGPTIDWKAPVIEDEEKAKIKFISDYPYYSNPKEVQQRQVTIVMKFLESKVDINAQDNNGWSVLHYASAFYPEGLQELLISHGANPNLKTNMGRTPADVLALRK